MTEEIALEIEGMRCASCAQTIEKALAASPGVERATVNVALKRGSVRFEPARASAASIVATIEQAGFRARTAPTDGAGAEPGPTDADERWGLEGWLGLAAAIPAIVLGHGPWGESLAAHLPGAAHGAGGAAASPALWASALLATTTVALAGRPFLLGAGRAVRRRRANMDLLVGTGAAIALAWSWAALLVPALAAGQHLSFEAAASLVLFVRAGKWLEARTRRQARATLEGLLSREPKRALLVTDEGEREVAAASLAAGDRFRVRAGDTLAADGVVLEGRSALDESFLTGESVPRAVAPGDEVPGGAINTSGVLLVRAERTGEATALRRIARLVVEAQAEKPPIQRFADRAASVFVPAVFVLAFATGVAWLGLGASPAAALARAVAVLVVACPCALGLATPVAVLVGSTAGLRRGILVRSAPTLEALARVRTVLLDKTGTLTRGRPSLVATVAAEGLAVGPLLEKVAALEARSTHPLARAIAAAARATPPPRSGGELRHRAGRGLPKPSPGSAAEAREASETPGDRCVGREGAAAHDAGPIGVAPGAAVALALVPGGEGLGLLAARAAADIADVVETPGHGLRGRVGGTLVVAGTREFLSDVTLDPVLGERAKALEAEGATLVHAAIDGREVLVLALRDEPRPEARSAVSRLRALGVRVAILSGDRTRAAQAVAAAVGIDAADVTAELSPRDKLAAITRAQATSPDGELVAMVGDGVNDAPALARADVGIALGAGTDVAKEAGSVVLLRDDLGEVATALELGRATLGKVRENLALATVYNLAAIPLAAGVFSRLGFELSPAVAGLAMGLSSVSVVANALRLSRFRPRG